MALARWALRLDGRLAIAALGTAAALLIPLAGTLAIHSLDSDDVVEPGWVLVHPDGEAVRISDLPERPERAVRLERGADRQLASYVLGDPRVGKDDALAMPLAPAEPLPGLRTRPGGPLALVPSTATLVHPSRMADAGVADALHTTSAEVRDRLVAFGLRALPADGGHAYLESSIGQVQSAAFALTAASIPVVAVVAAAFADLDAAEMSRTAAVVSALGHSRRARLLLMGRVVLLVVASALAALLVAGVLYRSSAAFRPSPLPFGDLALGVGLPALAAVAAGLWRSARSSRSLGTVLRAPAQQVVASPPIPGVPPRAQPLLLGSRLLAPILLAALLFMVDVGFPLAVAEVPQALTGGPGEAVRLDATGNLLGSTTDARLADVATLDPAVSAASAEILAPTVAGGEPLLVRGGEWERLAAFHGLLLTAGSPPQPGETVVGATLAARLGLDVGDRLVVPAVSRPLARSFVVAGTFAGGGLLESEAVVGLPDARDLAGLGRHQATVVRARPDTDAAIAALSRSAAQLEVTGLRMEPEAPPAGGLATAVVEVTNLGPVPGTRLLFVRVDGEAVAQVDARVPPYTTATFQASFVAPVASFSLAVNPTVEVPATPPAVVLSAPGLQPDSGAVRVSARQGDAPAAGLLLGLYRDAASARTGAGRIANATTDADGVARFSAPPPGLYVAATESVQPKAAAEVRVSSAADANTGRLVVRRLWVDPAQPRPGQETTVFVRVANVGGVQAEGTVPVGMDGGVVGLPEVTLAPGAETTLQVPVVALAGEHNVTAMDSRVSFRVAGPGAAQVAAGGGAGVARRSETLSRAAADQVLGNARGVLLGLGGTAMASSLALVALATARTVRHRQGLLPTLWALGLTPEWLRRRARFEAAAMGLVAALAAALVAAGLFAAAAAVRWPTAFGHAVPQPIGPIFAFQAAAAFAAACAVAASVAVGPLVEEGRLRRPGTEARRVVPPATVEDVLEGSR